MVVSSRSVLEFKAGFLQQSVTQFNDLSSAVDGSRCREVEAAAPGQKPEGLEPVSCCEELISCIDPQFETKLSVTASSV